MNRLLAWAGFAFCFVAACTRDQPPRAANDPVFPREVLALTTPDAKDFEEICEGLGEPVLARAFHTLWSALGADDAEERDRILSLLDVVASCYAERYDAGFARKWVAAYRRDPGVLPLMAELKDRLTAAERDSTALRDDELRERIAFCEELEAGDLGTHVAMCYEGVIAAMVASNAWADALRYAWRSARWAHADENPVMIAQVLAGTLPLIHSHAGNRDSVLAYFSRAFDVAVRSRIPDQAARIAHFYAYHYAADGRLGLASEYIDLGLELSRRFKGEFGTLRFVWQAMDWYADLRCWSLVERHRRYGRSLLELESHTRPSERNMALAFGYREGRHLIATGRAGEALARLPELRAFGPPPVSWALELRRVGRLDDALAMSDEALAPARRRQLSGPVAQLELLRAEVFLDRGDPDQAASALSAFERARDLGPSRDAWRDLRGSVARARLTTLVGTPRDARARLETAAREFLALVASLDGSEASYLLLANGDELRRELERANASEPDVLLALDQAWSTLGSRLDRPTKSGGTGSFLAEGGEIARRITSWARAVGGDYVAFRTDGPRVVRRHVGLDGNWTCDTLGVFVDDLRVRVRAVVERLSTDPGTAEAVTPSSLGDELTSIGAMLLPTTVLDEGGPLLVACDGVLRALPFAALGTDFAGYVPLVASRTVATLRHGVDIDRQGRPGDPNGSPLLVMDPDPPPELSRQHPGLGRLASAEDEYRSLRRVDPTVETLRDAEASKKRIVECWERAPWIYFCTHAVRSRDNPYNTFIPVAAAGAGFDALEASRLDVRDVRSATLTECELVVLSACGSGAPTLDDDVDGPSLADAFIDAGARAVVSTMWRVRDDQATSLMARFVDEWGGEESPASALSRAQRAFLGSPPRIRHPFHWAPYQVAFGLLD